MANEAVLVVRLEDPIDFTVADGTAITKGAILKLNDNMVASAGGAALDPIAGIAARDKVASDGRTQLGCYIRGIFRLKASGAITVGDAICADAQIDDNYVKTTGTTSNLSGARILGYALETATDNNYFLAMVNIQGGYITA